MNIIRLLLFVTLSVLASASHISFSQFASTHKRKYSNETERLKREKIYNGNLENVAKMNQHSALKGWSARFGVTKFADLEVAELHKSHMGFKASHISLASKRKAQKKTTTKKTTTKKTTTKKTTTTKKPTTTTTKTTTTTIPTTQAPSGSFDWTQQPGIVSAVKDQGNCGSCWAFATAAVLESYYARKGNPLTTLSEQQLVDCDTANGACNGGDPYEAFTYESLKGAEPDSVYPYTAVKQTCKYASSKALVRPLTFDFVSDETEMISILENNGPIEVAIWADPLQTYYGGILMEAQCDSTQTPNHAVTLVGYGTENGVPYWKIKNSWGSNWGENGYFRLERNANTCNIKYYAIYVIS